MSKGNPKAAMNAFKQMDKAANPGGVRPNFSTQSGPGQKASAKEIMLHWCQVMTKNYPGVDVKNFGSSWSDGLAFCALIHHFYPDAFDFSTLKAENRRDNFTLAFETAEHANWILRQVTNSWNAVNFSFPVPINATLNDATIQALLGLTVISYLRLGNVAPLLDVEDMLRMKVPDWKCVFTQIQLYYRRFQLQGGKGANQPPANLPPQPEAAPSL